MSDEDVFYDNQAEAFNKISSIQHKNKLTENYEVGYHGGLIQSMQKNQEQIIWKTIQWNYLKEKQKAQQHMGEIAKKQFEKFLEAHKTKSEGKIDKAAKANNGDKKQKKNHKVKNQAEGLDF